MSVSSLRNARAAKLLPGEVSEWLMVPLSKSGRRKPRGFESRPLRPVLRSARADHDEYQKDEQDDGDRCEEPSQDREIARWRRPRRFAFDEVASEDQDVAESAGDSDREQQPRREGRRSRHRTERYAR